MTPEERQLITGLFDRMRGFALAGKDGEAEALIKQQVGSLPDAPYMLVQSTLVLEQALQQADLRVKELEEQVRTLQETQQPAPSAGTGSFLGGLFGNRAAAPEQGASVPAVGARATPSAYGSPRSAWDAPQAGAPTAAPPQPGGGGFLQSAMTTAAGVAGGMLAASTISSWLGSGSSHASTSTASAQQAQPTAADSTTSTGGATQASHETGQTDQAGSESQAGSYHEAADEDDDGGWFGGDDSEA